MRNAAMVTWWVRKNVEKLCNSRKNCLFRSFFFFLIFFFVKIIIINILGVGIILPYVLLVFAYIYCFVL